MKPFIWEPDFLFGLGEAGEHPITVMAWIDEDSYPGRVIRSSVKIVKAIVLISDGDLKQELDVTKLLAGSQKWRDWVYDAWCAPREQGLQDEGA